VDIEELAGLTDGMVGSHIAFICKRATMLAIAELIHNKQGKNQKKLLVTAAHFKAALHELRGNNSEGINDA
jgi:SpoVK/Ycf46/Vps4 family AAA+-type ATPase